MFYIINSLTKEKLTVLPYSRTNAFNSTDEAVEFIKKVYINNDDFTSPIIKIVEGKDENWN